MNNITSNNNYGFHMHKYISPNHLLVILLFSSPIFAMNLEKEFGEYQNQFLAENMQPLNMPVGAFYNLPKRCPTMIEQAANSDDSGHEIVITPPLKRPAIQASINIAPQADSNDEGEKIYFCKIPNCSKKYTTLWYLKRHLITHSQERPFICTECNYSFKFNYHLTAHLNVVHSNAHPYSCIICSKGYKRSSDLNKHIKKSHAMKCPRKEPIQQSLAQSSPPIVPLQ